MDKETPIKVNEIRKIVNDNIKSYVEEHDMNLIKEINSEILSKSKSGEMNFIYQKRLSYEEAARLEHYYINVLQFNAEAFKADDEWWLSIRFSSKCK